MRVWEEIDSFLYLWDLKWGEGKKKKGFIRLLIFNSDLCYVLRMKSAAAAFRAVSLAPMVGREGV